MTGQGAGSRKSFTMSNSNGRKKFGDNPGTGDASRKSVSSSVKTSMGLAGERTVKRLRLSKALTVPDSTTVYEACRRMAARRVDALLLTDSNALLCGILTAKDIALRVVAREINLEETPVSKVMTKNPIFVLSDTLAVEALQKMVQGKFRHLPVVENGEVVALLDIAKCLYDAIARLERAAEKGKAIAAAVEGVEKTWATSLTGQNMFIETLREKMFKPSLSSIVAESLKPVTVSPFESVVDAAKKMLELRSSCAMVVAENSSNPLGILTSKDILMRIIARNLSPASTLVEKVMTSNPQCANLDTPIVDALHNMHNGKFLHLPVIDRDGNILSVVDVLHITHAAVATITQVGNNTGVNNEAANSIMQNFFDSAMALGTEDDDDNRSDSSLKFASEGTETGRSYAFPSTEIDYVFSFKIEDRRGRMHRFDCDTRSISELIKAIVGRLRDEIDEKNLPQIMYEDDDHDKVVLATDNDLATAIKHARAAGLKSLRLHLEHFDTNTGAGRKSSLAYATSDAWASAFSGAAAGAALVVGLGVLTYLRRSNN